MTLAATPWPDPTSRAAWTQPSSTWAALSHTPWLPMEKAVPAVFGEGAGALIITARSKAVAGRSRSPSPGAGGGGAGGASARSPRLSAATSRAKTTEA